MNSYTVGTLVRLTGALAAVVGGAAVDATLAVNMRTPDGASASLTVVRDGAGAYHADFVPTMLGLRQYEWVATGAAQVTNVGQFLVTQTTW